MSESLDMNQVGDEVSSSRSASDIGIRGPYEGALGKIFDKLTSEILLFLLGYTILLIGLLYFSESIPDTWRNLLYLIPILGVLAYIWLQQKGIRNYAREQYNIDLGEVKLTSLIAKDNAYVGGILGALHQLGNIRVFSFWASGDAEVIGIDERQVDQVEGVSGEENRVESLSQLMVRNFEELGEDAQLKALQYIRKLRSREESG